MAGTVSKRKGSGKNTNKRIRLAVIIGAAVVAAVVIAAVLTFVLSSQAKNEVRGNRMNNISGYGTMVENGDGYIYSHFGLLDESGNELRPENAYYLNMYDGWLYYTVNTGDGVPDENGADEDGPGYIARMRPDGSEWEKIVDHRGMYLNIINDKLYFCYTQSYATDIKEKTGIYSVNLDGSGLTRITTDEAHKLAVYGNRMYFINKAYNYTLYSMNMDGSNRRMLTDQLVRTFNIYDGRIYFATNTEMLSMGLDGANVRRLLEAEVTELFVFEEHIYFCNINVMGDSSEDIPLVRMELSGDNAQLVYELPVTGLSEIHGELYMVPYSAEEYLIGFDPDTAVSSAPLKKGSLAQLVGESAEESAQSVEDDEQNKSEE